jgi:hypothetical protein
VVHGGRLSFLVAWGVDRFRARARHVAGRSRPTQLVGGVTLPVPPTNYRRARAFYRNRVLLMRHQSASVHWPYPRIISGPDPVGLQGAMILATFHMGPVWALGGLLARLPGPVCVLRGGGDFVARADRSVAAVGGETQRVAAVTEAVHTLRAGGYAFVVVDRVGNAPVQAEVLGRTIVFAGGAFALARLADAPLLPLVARWRGAAVEIVAGEPIAPAGKMEMAGRLSRWLEQYLRQHPCELSFPLSQRLAAGGRSAVSP